MISLQIVAEFLDACGGVGENNGVAPTGFDCGGHHPLSRPWSRYGLCKKVWIRLCLSGGMFYTHLL